MNAERPVCDAIFPPGLIFFEEVWSVYDVVMIVHIVEKVLHQ